MVVAKRLFAGPSGGGPRRVDDRRVISGIIPVLQSGMRWRDCPQAYGPATTIYNRWHRWSQQGLWQKLFYELSQNVGTHYENSIDSTAIKAHRSARGKKRGQDQALGTSRSGCATKIHAVIDRKGRPLRFLLSGGQARPAVPLLKPLPLATKQPIRLMTAPRSGIGLRGAAPPRSFPTRSIAASHFPITSAPIVTATRSRACSAASKTHAASLPVTTNAPTTSSAPST
jgi:transposase